MNFVVYRSLDKKRSLFGLRGSYLTYAIFAVVALAVVAFMIAGITNGLIGILAYIAFVAIAYFVIIQIQGKMSERERSKWMCSKVIPSVIVFNPKRCGEYVKFHITQQTAYEQKRTVKVS